MDPTPTPPPAPSPDVVATHNEVTRRQIVYLIFLQWNMLLIGVLGAMIWKGWELSPATTNVVMIALTQDSSLVAAVGAFYLGMQYQLSKGDKA